MKSDSKSTSIKKPVLYFLVSIVLILVAAVLFLLVKVFTQQKAISSSITPEVGNCYNLSQKELDSLTPLSKPVDCESSHNSETYRVGEWTETLSPWKMPVAEITASVEKVCIPWNLPENTSLNYWFFYLPNESDWDSGARWIRCDAANQITDTDGNKSFDTWVGAKSSNNESTQSQTEIPNEVEKVQGLAGNWDSRAGDAVGYSLIISEESSPNYKGEIYFHYQNGSMEKELVIGIEDKGAGIAEITWPNGDTNTAGWGVRDENTPKDMVADWNGDIWLECVGYLKWATSRAECNFFLVN